MKKKISKKPPRTIPSPKLKSPGFFYLSLLLSITTIAVSYLVKAQMPPEIPLYYGLAEGEEQIASSYLLALPSLIGFGILVLNTFLSFLTKNVYSKKILILSAFAANLLATITTVKIILLVGGF